MNIEAYLTRDYVKNLVKEGKRLDGRGLEDMRPFDLDIGFAKEKADGSARIKLGETDVAVGISLDLGDPYSDRPNDGVMTTSVELRPIADPNFELGPPREESIELARVVDRGIRESGAIDTGKLLVEFEEGNKVWIVFIDIHILNNAGDLITAAGLAAMAALHNARMPPVKDGMVVRGEWTDEKLPITCTPVPVTVAKIGEKLVVDPIIEEEYAMDARLTVATSGETINAMQKGGGFSSLSLDEVNKVIDFAYKLGDEIRPTLTGK